MSRTEEAVQSLVDSLERRASGFMSAKQAEKVVSRLGLSPTSASGCISTGVQQKKFRRFKDADGKAFIYMKGAMLPEGAKDFGHKLMRNRRKDPTLPVPQARSTNPMLLTVQWGSNRSESLTVSEARELRDQLNELFGG